MESNSPGKTHTLSANYTVSPNVVIEGRYAYGYGAIFTKTIGLLAKDVSPIAVNVPMRTFATLYRSFPFLTGTFDDFDRFRSSQQLLVEAEFQWQRYMDKRQPQYEVWRCVLAVSQERERFVWYEPEGRSVRSIIQ